MKGIIVLDKIPKACVDCPMCYHAGDMSIGNFKYERLYRCKLEPEEIEGGYLCDILHKKPEWCVVKKSPTKLRYCDYKNAREFVEGFNVCVETITGEK